MRARRTIALLLLLAGFVAGQAGMLGHHHLEERPSDPGQELCLREHPPAPHPDLQPPRAASPECPACAFLKLVGAAGPPCSPALASPAPADRTASRWTPPTSRDPHPDTRPRGPPSC